MPRFDESPRYTGSLSRMGAKLVEKQETESSAFWHGLSCPRILKSRPMLFHHCPFGLGSDSGVSYGENSTEPSVMGMLEEARKAGCVTWRWITTREPDSSHARVKTSRKALGSWDVQSSQWQNQILMGQVLNVYRELILYWPHSKWETQKEFSTVSDKRKRP